MIRGAYPFIVEYATRFPILAETPSHEDDFNHQESISENDQAPRSQCRLDAGNCDSTLPTRCNSDVGIIGGEGAKQVVV